MGEGFLDRLAERMSRFTGTRTVFGEPIERDGLTIVPVTKFKMRFRGQRGTAESEEAVSGEGGGQVCSKPIGYLEIRNGKARFRPVQDADHIVLAMLGSGLLLFLTIRAVLASGSQTNSRLMDTMKQLSERVNPLAMMGAKKS